MVETSPRDKDVALSSVSSFGSDIKPAFTGLELRGPKKLEELWCTSTGFPDPVRTAAMSYVLSKKREVIESNGKTSMS